MKTVINLLYLYEGEAALWAVVRWFGSTEQERWMSSGARSTWQNLYLSRSSGWWTPCCVKQLHCLLNTAGFVHVAAYWVTPRHTHQMRANVPQSPLHTFTLFQRNIPFNPETKECTPFSDWTSPRWSCSVDKRRRLSGVNECNFMTSDTVAERTDVFPEYKKWVKK